MQQQQPSSIIRQRLALRSRSRMALCAMLAALILGPKCRASAEESGVSACDRSDVISTEQMT